MEGIGGVGALMESRAAVRAAQVAVARMRGQLYQAGSGDLAELMGELGELALEVDAAEVAVVAEAIGRGEPGADSPPRTACEWVASHSRRYAATGAGRVVRVATGVLDPRREAFTTAVLGAEVPVAAAVVVLTELERLIPSLRPEVVPTVEKALLDLGARWDARTVRGLRQRLLAEYGDHGLDDVAEGAHRGRCLSRGSASADGLWEYKLILDTPARAAFEAALGPVSAPAPALEGERDLRSAEQRRADGLVAIVERASQHAGTPAGVKASVIVTVPVSDLNDEAGCGLTFGGVDSGEVLTPAAVRQATCDGSVTLAFVDAYGVPVALSRTVRFFSLTQTRQLWLRDRECSFPGCAAPATWCHAHHLVHWADGGATDLSNGALLCGRHHRLVHTQRYHGEVTTSGVRWDLTAGAYDRHLAALGRDPAPDDHHWREPAPDHHPGRDPAGESDPDPPGEWAS